MSCFFKDPVITPPSTFRANNVIFSNNLKSLGRSAKFLKFSKSIRGLSDGEFRQPVNSFRICPSGFSNAIINIKNTPSDIGRRVINIWNRLSGFSNGINSFRNSPVNISNTILNIKSAISGFDGDVRKIRNRFSDFSNGTLNKIFVVGTKNLPHLWINRNKCYYF